ncbi:hypothetical protein LG202_08780 [Methylobacillus methanolivorans]
MKFLALIPLLLIGANAQAATIEIGTPQYIRPVGDQLWYFPGNERESPRVAWPGMENNPRDINVPTSKGRLPVTINQKTPVSLNKLGGPIVNLAKRLGPVGVAFTIADALCSLETICPARDGSNTWEKVEEPDPDYPSETPPYGYWCCNTEMQQPSRLQPTPELVCKYAEANYPPPVATGGYVFRPGGAFGYGGCAYQSNPSTIVQNIARTTGCASGYWLDGTVCRKTDDGPKYRPVVPGDWDTVPDNPGLHDPGLIPDILDGGEPVPVDTPTIDPKTVPGPAGSTTETIRNGTGEPIGTKTTDTTVTITPSGPTTVNVTETTTVTETNITNNTTTTTVSETTLPNNEDQTDKDPEDIETDNVQDTDLETYEVPDTFTYDSWGGGSCPGDPAVSVLGKSLVIPVHTVCDGLTMLRPVVLIIAALASAFIIVGAVKE